MVFLWSIYEPYFRIGYCKIVLLFKIVLLGFYFLPLYSSFEFSLLLVSVLLRDIVASWGRKLGCKVRGEPHPRTLIGGKKGVV